MQRVKIKLIAAVVFGFGIYSCTKSPEPAVADNPNFSKPVIAKTYSETPILTTQFSGKAFPPIFEAAFFPGTKVLQGEFNFTFSTYDLGKIKIEGGKIIACDPTVMDEELPFAQNFPIGNFPVQLAMTQFENIERVAYCRILFSENPVAEWKYASFEGEVQPGVRDTIYDCYESAGGAGMFIDAVSNLMFIKKGEVEWQKVFETKSNLIGNKGFLHEFEGHNLVSFSIGSEEGCFGTLIGYDDMGQICRLITDMDLIEWWRNK